MRLLTLLIASTMFAVPAFAQKSQSSSNPNAVQIQGNTEIKADQKNVTAVAVGEGNVAKNTAGAIKGGTQIQGNTKIKAFTERKSSDTININAKKQATKGSPMIIKSPSPNSELWLRPPPKTNATTTNTSRTTAITRCMKYDFDSVSELIVYLAVTL